MSLLERTIFAADDRYEIAGLPFRVGPGRKGDGDLILYVLTREGWRMVPMELSFFLADFHGQVEDVLYKRTGRGEGGSYFLNAVRGAMRNGYKHAQAILESEKYFSRRPQPPQPKLFDWEREGLFGDEEVA